MRPILTCSDCGPTQSWLLLPGTGHHAGRAVCPDCGRWLRWVPRRWVERFGYDLAPPAPAPGGAA